MDFLVVIVKLQRRKQTQHKYYIIHNMFNKYELMEGFKII